MEMQISYRAFLSYSHSDRSKAAWLHRTLESYRVPSKLIGMPTAFGPVPARLSPVFRDREELSAAGNLGESIESALAQSLALIVICSPSAAASRWVNEEIRCFKRLHGEKRIFAVIIAGEPCASDTTERREEECFPPALRFHVGPDGVVTSEPAEPIATDLRPAGDGRRHGKLKLVAGLLGLRLDDLVQRESHRRHRRLVYVSAASMAGMAVTSALAIVANEARQESQLQRTEAERQRSEADGLVEFMLTDLRGKLEPVGRLDVLKSVGDRALDYYGRQDLDSLDADALGRRARAMLLVAEVGDLQGNGAAARRGFAEAARSTAELLRREPGNWQRLYDHAQSEFWLAYDSHNRGDNRRALLHFLAYRDLGRRMVAAAPKRPESHVELASAEVNLGVAFVRDRRPPEALSSFDRAARAFSDIRPRTREIALNLNQALGHKASALYALGNNVAALATRREQLEILARPPLSSDDREVQEARNVILAQIGILHLADGDLDSGRRSLDQAVDNWEELVALDSANGLWRGERNAARMWKAVATSADDRAMASAELAQVMEDQRRLIGQSPDWVYKINLLRMISFDCALRGRACQPTGSVITEAVSRRDALTLDERAALAAVLISEGDRIAPADRPRAQALWREASQLLSADFRSTWNLIQQTRAERRLRQRSHLSGIPPKAFAGIFSEGAGR
jgi:tetratricopeptide (TPR) repeat protein